VSRVGPYWPTAEDGLIAEGTVASLGDVHVPAIDRLNPALLQAFRRAEADAAVDGVAFQVTSGWRDVANQRWLFEDTVEQYGSAEVARRIVATPERSSHVTGDALDIGPVDAQLWLMEHGSDYGLCQTYATGRWHYELEWH
jgi:LAS superfamily LD-carboxypeptidase LdcB